MEIYLRPLAVEDALVSFRWRNNPEVWKYTGSRPDQVITPEIETEWLQNVLMRGNEKRFAICLKQSGEYVGNVQLTGIGDDTAEFHIFVGEMKYWGMKIGTKATALMLEIGFKDLGLKEIYLHVAKENLAAISSYHRCGFQLLKEDSSGYQMICKAMNE